MRHIVATALMLALAACQREAQPVETPVEPVPAPAPSGGTPLAYECESGQAVTARYPDQETAEVTWQGRGTTLRIAPSGSGARYVGGGLEWWTVTRGDREQAVLGRVPAGSGESQLLERCARDVPATPAPIGLPPGSAPACAAANLSVARAGGDAGMGNRVLVVGLTNTGTAGCALMGYPGVGLLDAEGEAVTSVRSENTPSSYFRAEDQPALVTLAPRGRAYFDIASTAVPAEHLGETECPSTATVAMTVPGDTAALTLTSPMTPCGRRVRVSPFRSVAEPAAEAAEDVEPAPAEKAEKE